MSSKYYLGLDIGTSSIGYCVTDENNKIVKKNGHTLWGVRMFETAQTAKERGIFRRSRRRLQRRKERIALLQNEFLDEINQIDKNFFQRLNDSFFKTEDKLNKNHYTFFDDEKTDKEYFEQFPTIYHLRLHLLKTKEKADIRMLYLALHHIIKYRGHFLYEGESFKIGNEKIVNTFFDEFNYLLTQLKIEFEDSEKYFEEIENIDDDLVEKINKIINGKDKKEQKKKDLRKVLGVDKKTIIGEFVVPLLVGSDISVNTLSIVKHNKYDKCSLSLQSNELLENIEECKSIVSELSAVFEMVPRIKEIADYFYLLKLIGEYEYLSEAMVNIYDEHNSDLIRLKKFIKKYLPNEYNNCFKKVEIIDKKTLNNYPHYIGMNSTSSQIKRFKHCSKEDFYKYLKTLFNKITEESSKEEKEYFVQKMDNDEFLPRQNNSQNSSIPMQLNYQELCDILENQSKFYPFLSMKTDKYTTTERIKSIFTYKIPYYVGPLNSKEYGWVERKAGKILPWNFDEMIDFEETTKKFIQRMQNKCQYLHGLDDYCLPQKSILFSEYKCLQYLNRLTINGSILSVEEKKHIYTEVFLKNKKPTRKKIIDFLKSAYNYNESDFTSKIEEVVCDMSSYIKFKEIFKDEMEENLPMIEEIIKDVTLFQDKNILAKRLKDTYNLSDDKISKIKSLNYKGYATLSKHFLNDFYSINDETGERHGPIIQIMRDNNLELQQILFSEEYKFMDSIAKYNNQFVEEENYLDFIEENLYVSPMMKRPLIQTFKLIEEIEKILNQKISKYYVECTRTAKAQKTKSISRYDRIVELYKECKKQAIKLKEQHINLNKLEDELKANQNLLRAESIYLYFTQLGKCMYTLEDMSLDDVKKGVYDIDHIYPKSRLYDDSFNNKVLVNKHINEKIKGNKFIFELPNFLPKEAKQFYEKLESLKLISKEKLRRLTMKELPQGELDSFLNRQLVTTNQAVKGVIELLKLYKKVSPTNIIYSKAENVSDFRHEYKLPKSRLANNYHHAHDAYLNIIVGQVLNTYFTHYNIRKFSDFSKWKNENITYNPLKIFEKDRYIKLKDGQMKYIWKLEYLEDIKKNMYQRFDINETLLTKESNQLFSKTSILPVNPDKKASNLIPIKSLDSRYDPDKYGGITSHSYYKYVIVEQTNKKNIKEYILEAIPRMYKGKEADYIASLYERELTKGEIINYKIVCDNIRTNVVIEYEKMKFAITGITGNSLRQKNLKDRNFSYKAILIIKKLEKYQEQLKNKIEIPTNGDVIKLSSNQAITKEDCDNLFEEIKKLFEKDIYNYKVIIETIIQKFFPKITNELAIDIYAKLLIEVLGLLKTNESKTADFSSISKTGKEDKYIGSLTINKKLIPGMKFISESLTGYYRKILFVVPEE